MTKSKTPISNIKIRVLPFIICVLSLFLILCPGVCRSYAQDANKLGKRITEAKSNEDAQNILGEAKDLYFKEHKYNDFVDFLNYLEKKNKALSPVISYYTGLTRYNQLKYLEEAQSWDEYFSQGNTYREQITVSLNKAKDLFSPSDALSLDSGLILWKFHRDQQDAANEAALNDLMSSALAYAKDAKDITPIKDVAGELLSYGEKAKARQIYKVYTDKLITSDIKESELNTIASNFYKEGNLDLAQALYDVYIEKITKSAPKERSIPALMDIAKTFAYSPVGTKDKGLKDASYAEKVFQKIEDLGGKDIFNEELIYLRAFNLEKAKDYSQAKDYYLELVKQHPKTIHLDESDFKIGIIYTYILRDIKTGKSYFQALAQKETVSPQVISSLYQLGLLSQWEEDVTQAKEYYNKLLEIAKDNSLETVTLAKERLKEIEEAKPIEYNLKSFLDVSLKEENAIFDMTRVDLRSNPYSTKGNESIEISTSSFAPQSGCMQIELQYLWSGDLGKTKPSSSQTSFNTAYLYPGTKEINLVVVSPSGVIDSNIDLVDVY
jgi:tetratricopeptide (TPR) repeat protein